MFENIWAQVRRGNRGAEETTYCSGDKIEKNEMGRACSVWGRGEAYTGCRWGTLREIDHVGYPGIDGRIILRWIFRK